jgi:hypothetical protein
MSSRHLRRVLEENEKQNVIEIASEDEKPPSSGKANIFALVLRNRKSLLIFIVVK